jgi:hypothetical protein
VALLGDGQGDLFQQAKAVDAAVDSAMRDDALPRPSPDRPTCTVYKAHGGLPADTPADQPALSAHQLSATQRSNWVGEDAY